MIKWKKPERWYTESECEKYTVSKSIVYGKPKYAAWYDGTALNIFDDAEKAKQRCETHKTTGK